MERITISAVGGVIGAPTCWHAPTDYINWKALDRATMDSCPWPSRREVPLQSVLESSCLKVPRCGRRERGSMISVTCCCEMTAWVGPTGARPLFYSAPHKRQPKCPNGQSIISGHLRGHAFRQTGLVQHMMVPLVRLAVLMGTEINDCLRMRIEDAAPDFRMDVKSEKDSR